MDKEQQIINVQSNLTFKQSTDPTLELSKKQLTQRYDYNLNQVVNGFRNVPTFYEAQKLIKNDSLYKVIIPKNISKRLDDGSAEWNFDKTGMMLPTIKDQNGSFVCQARLEETNPINFSNVNDIALQSTMAAILEQLELLNEQVSDVLRGQFTDRIGVIEGAIDTYKQALLARDKNISKQLLTQAVSELNKGRRQLIESLGAKTKFINELPQSSFKQIFYSLFRKVDTNKIEGEFLETQTIFDSIIKSSNYLGLIYEELGEINSLKESFVPLKDCINEYAIKMEKVAEFLPYNPVIENQYIWYKNPEKIIEIIDSHIHKLDAEYIEIQLAGEQLLLKKEEVNLD
ncbi:hypothetical protein [Fictibacillus phosphorivorans]|uniref:hypothetical protein n=1 Tax=Fictibacillus phosphorivorans TaxID=1221500 RepID=UPI001292F48F|nr:hypothetical protein [Fictibacillus phosphorivorans]MQR94190.1 hypothetical protein [Fictibacillus phosphorivorans]